ncbi:MAG: hypothetical protein AAGG07_06945 [Planctomycetota bacterium]
MKQMIVLACGAAMMAGAAGADTVESRKASPSRGDGAATTINFGGNSNRVFAGELRNEFRNGTGVAEELNGRTIAGFCTDVDQPRPDEWTVYNVVPLADAQDFNGGVIGTERAEAVKRLIAYERSLSNNGVADNADQFAVAFQLAIWEVTYDYSPTLRGGDGLDIDSGDFSASGIGAAGLQAQLNDFLTNGLAFGGSVGGKIFAISNDTYQDQFFVIIPTPTAAAMGLFGVAGIAARRRR